MDLKEYLDNLINQLNEQRTNLRGGMINAETPEERTAILESIDRIDKEIEAAQEQKNALTDNGNKEQGFNPLASYSLRNGQNDTQRLEGADSIEYRTAFMKYVVSNVPISDEVRANANTKTTDVGSVMPPVVVNKIIEKMDNVGMILPLVTKTSYASGINIPTSSVKPVATWVAEGATSDKQKKTTGMIQFSANKLRCEISMSMEVGTMALKVFEDKFAENVAKAMVKAREDAIINGDGSGKPKGILKETPAEGQALTIPKSGKLEYKTLTSAEAVLPDEYEGTAKWCMSKTTFMSFIGMTDSAGQPIARINYGINGKPERMLLGREVVTASAYMKNYQDTVTEDTLFAFLFDFTDYVENTIYDMGIQKKQDWDTEDLLTKAVMSVDGKVVDKTSLVTLTKKVA